MATMIATQADIGTDLFFAEQAGLCQVCIQVYKADLCLQACDLIQ